MSDMDRKRDFVTGISSSPGWKKKVQKMSDAQVIAIYLKEQNKPKSKPEEPKESNDDGIPF